MSCTADQKQDVGDRQALWGSAAWRGIKGATASRGEEETHGQTEERAERRRKLLELHCFLQGAAGSNSCCAPGMCTGMLWWCGLGLWRGWGQHAWGHGAAHAGWGGSSATSLGASHSSWGRAGAEHGAYGAVWLPESNGLTFLISHG